LTTVGLLSDLLFRVCQMPHGFTSDRYHVLKPHAPAFTIPRNPRWTNVQHAGHAERTFHAERAFHASLSHHLLPRSHEMKESVGVTPVQMLISAAMNRSKPRTARPLFSYLSYASKRCAISWCRAHDEKNPTLGEPDVSSTGWFKEE
jgi:hypothetical protein